MDKKRLDILIMEKHQISRTQAARLINDGHVQAPANPEIKKLKSALLFSDDEFNKLVVELPAPKKTNIQAENIPLKIIYEDSDLLVVHKAPGMVVHPACNNYTGTLVNALMHHINDLSDIGGEIRPGIVHRLDKDTEGLLVVAKNNPTHQALSKQFAKHTITRKYYALIQGNLSKEHGTITGNLERSSADRKKIAVVQNKGKHAVTHYQVVKRHNSATLVDISLETGRTHQIRAHFAHLQHPLIGDPIYHKSYQNKKSGLKLIAYKLGFIHPKTKEYLEFEAELPVWFKKYS